MTLGAGFRYLMSSVARGDAASRTSDPLTAYYTAHGTPPGRLLGNGLVGLDGGRGVRSGAVVTEENLWRMLGMLQDPITGEQLGRSPGVAVRRSSEPNEHSPQWGRSSKTVAGFDLTFSAPKSVSVAWALAGPDIRRRIRTAHEEALQFVIRYAEREVFATRTGRGGVVSQDVLGVVGAAFEHWDSRAGDPQLHTHVVVLNRVQAASDGAWRTLDSKALFRAAVGLSELYNGVLADLLTADLGVGWEPQRRRRSAEPKWELAGVPETLQREFSQRSDQIEQAKERLVSGFAASNGRQPMTTEVLKLRQQATLESRPDKHVTSLAALVSGWRQRALPDVGAEQQPWVTGLAGRNELPLLTAGDLAGEILADTADLVLDNVASRRATFTRPNLFAEALRQIAGVRFATPGERVIVAEVVTRLAVERAVRLSPEDVDLELLPESLRRPDGTSRLRPRDAVKYSSRSIIEAEQRLLEAGRSVQGPTVDEQLVAVAVGRALPRGQVLSSEQAAAVTSVATSGRRLDVLVGPAGTGKSTTMGGVRAVWEEAFGAGSVVGLAPSAAAAEVLADAVGIPTENTTKWLVELARLPDKRDRLAELTGRLRAASPSLRTRALRQEARRLADDLARFTPRPGQLLIVDEASMAGTLELDQITTAALSVGAKILLVGDWAQLSPVAAGGAFKLLATDRDAPPELHDVRRFRHEWERTASLKLRAGRPMAVEHYVRHGRVVGGDRSAILDDLFGAWRADRAAGRTTLMTAIDAQTVRELNSRARAHRVALGEVALTGVALADGVTIGVGDDVVTRLNQRDLSSGSPSNEGAEWVKNGDQWVVAKIHRDGAIQVRRPRGGRVATLPAAYVRDHVELGYATTAHRAQGLTVDTAHAYVTATTTREPLYVMATRGRESNRLYVDTTSNPDPATAHDGGESATPQQVLRTVLERSGADVSATAARAQESATGAAPGRLEAEWVAVMDARRQQRYVAILRAAGLTDAAVGAAKCADTWRELIDGMRRAERAGIEPESLATSVLNNTIGARMDAQELSVALLARVALLVDRTARPHESGLVDRAAEGRTFEMP